MENHSGYYALWANDINKYLNSGYNSKSLEEVYYSLLNYISIDSENPVNTKIKDISLLLKMTGLELDFQKEPFMYNNKFEEITSSYRVENNANYYLHVRDKY
jgi:hypothetical protein